MAEVLTIMPLEGRVENYSGIGLTPSDYSQTETAALQKSGREAEFCMSTWMDMFMHVLI